MDAKTKPRPYPAELRNLIRMSMLTAADGVTEPVLPTMPAEPE
jgi:hypothetical protein